MELLNQAFWQHRWETAQTGWDIGYAAPAIIEYMQKYPNKEAKILIPGCGNAYEAEALVELGFKNIYLIDIAPMAIDHLKIKFKNTPQIQIYWDDFFKHQESYDLLIEQTFFCAIDPILRLDYVNTCYQLLKPKGKLIGLLFNIHFDKPGPPFGGNLEEYRDLFSKRFIIHKMEMCFNSIPPRSGNELFIEFERQAMG